MKLSVIYTRAQSGIKAPLVTVETDLTFGLPGIYIVGLPETAVKESRERVRSALLNLQFEFPTHRITINLAPAEFPKQGGRFDLPIALGILAASQQIPGDKLQEYEFAGELALSGELRPINGALPFAIACKATNRKLILPVQNADEASLLKDIEILPARNLAEVCAHLTGQRLLIKHEFQLEQLRQKDSLDLIEVLGQTHAKRALEIAAAGGHSLLFIGPPGTGKTMLASRLTSILPDMNEKQALETAAIVSVGHRKFNANRWRKRPFRSPHHSASSVALVGGGNPPKPGEISLAHGGVLFLDELPEFNRSVLEALREPLESGKITISRAAMQSEFPANFQFIASMNPCPCGHLGDSQNNCRCSLQQIQRYQASISGPILDRIDMHVRVPRLTADMLMAKDKYLIGESSKIVKKRIEKSRKRQQNRSGKINAKLTNRELEQHTNLTMKSKELLRDAIKKFKLSARSYHRIIKVALSIADLDTSSCIDVNHISEALGFRKIT